ncbi:stabilizer of axonemal microtubules 2-like [Uloborus diversus]|uniref:stabilizer of axonemal microtubules 2-like n=1 Tax=Uloborus diversus TaxID=327109 RepID=UPI002409FF7A|nr:stabilizer of axonemal microtubules 2-like [Uloborus diversus]
MRQCICQICICGRHRCEHKGHRRTPFAKDDIPLEKTTENKDRFRPFGLQPRRKPAKPPQDAPWKGTEPTIHETTTRKDYIPWPFQKRALMFRPEVRQKPKGKMADTTTYGKDFKPKRGEKVQPKKIASGAKAGVMPGTGSGKIEGSTTYGKAYVPKPCSKREAAAAKGCTLTELGKPFSGVTETKLQYQAPPQSKREPASPLKGQLKMEGDMDCTTSHRRDYTPYVYQPPVKPIKKKSKSWSPGGDGTFKGETTHSHDYKCPPPTKRVEATLPKHGTQGFRGDFEGISHYKHDFPPHEVIPHSLPPWHPTYRPHTAPSAPMQGTTTYRRDYEAPPDSTEPTKHREVKNNLTLASGPMEKYTTHMRDFPRKDITDPIRSCKPDTKYRKPEGKFAGLSITAGDFTPKQLSETRAFEKQPDNLKPGKGAMEDLTTTMEDFRWMCLDCPAAYLKKYGKDALEPTWNYEKYEKGHEIYRKKRKKDKKKLHNKSDMQNKDMRCNKKEANCEEHQTLVTVS